MTDSQWRVLDGEGNEQGPYSTSDLQDYFKTGNITHDTMIWTEGLDEWVPAGKVEGLLPDIPQAVELATAAPAPVAPIAGISPGSQMAGVSPAGLAASGKTPIPTWVSIFTIIIGIAALALNFLPWTAVTVDRVVIGKEGRMEVFSQSGIQSITQKVTPNKEFYKALLSMVGIPDEQADKMADEAIEEIKSGKIDDLPFGRSDLAMGALILTGVGLLLAIIGLVNQIRILLLISQISLVVGAILVSVQMVQQFPAVKAMMEEQQKELQLAADTAEAAKKGDGAKAKKEMANVFQSKIEPACYATVGTLGFSLLLLVVTLSSSGNPTVTIPQPGSSTSPAQPGGFTLQ